MTIRQKPQMKARADSTTEHLTDLEPQNPWNDTSELH